MNLNHVTTVIWAYIAITNSGWLSVFAVVMAIMFFGLAESELKQ